MLGQNGIRQLVAPAVAAVLVSALLGCGQSAGAAHRERVEASVERVVDGDTLVLSGAGKVRLIGIDTPEVYGRVGCFGPEAAGFARRMLAPGARVSYRVGREPRDPYGRLLAYVYLRDGRMANELLAARGYATPLTIPPNVEFADRFAYAARAARGAGRGLWARCPGTEFPK